MSNVVPPSESTPRRRVGSLIDSFASRALRSTHEDDPQTHNNGGLQIRPSEDVAARKRCLDDDDGDGVDLDGASPSSSGMFSCNICMEMASDPVVTLCGHLYCWPCLYRWLHTQKSVRTCPVCKAGVDRDKVIPVFGRGGNEDPRKRMDTADTPSRPLAQRPGPVVLAGSHARNHVAYMPNMNWFGGYGEGLAMTPEQQHQAFLSRLLLMLGSFVIMCLLLF